MKIGYPNNPRKNILEEIEWIGRNKFDFVDLFLEEDMAVPEKIDVEKVKKLLKKYKLDIVGHTAWYLPIGSPIKSLREAAIKEAVRYFEVFRKVGAEFVTIHANWPGGSMFSEKEGMEFQVDSLRKLVKEAKKYKIKIIYELVTTPMDSIENISTITKKVPGLFLHLDTGHANLFGKTPEKVIKKFRGKIKHVHMHDSKRDLDLHLPMGFGTINWVKTIRTLKKYYDGTITLEIFNEDKNYILFSKEKLRKMWNSEG